MVLVIISAVSSSCNLGLSFLMGFVCVLRTLVEGWGLHTTPWDPVCQVSTCESSIPVIIYQMYSFTHRSHIFGFSFRPGVRGLDGHGPIPTMPTLWVLMQANTHTLRRTDREKWWFRLQSDLLPELPRSNALQGSGLGCNCSIMCHGFHWHLDSQP